MVPGFFGTRMPGLGSGSKILERNELKGAAVPWAGLGSSEGLEPSVSGAIWPWMSSSSSVPNLSISLLHSPTCPAVGTVGVPRAVGSPWPPQGDPSACPSPSRSRTNKCTRLQLKKQKNKNVLLQNPSPHHLLPRASVFPGFAGLSSLFALPPRRSRQCQVRKVPGSAPSPELFPSRSSSSVPGI